MKNQITLVSAPDDVLHDAVRILLVDLTQEQTQVVSESLMSFDTIPPTVVYVWSSKDTVEWLADKRLKSHAIIFNADSDKSEIVGYLASQSNTHYFGTLKDLGVLNKRTIYSTDDFKGIITRYFKQYEI
jgi:hypothetical protein